MATTIHLPPDILGSVDRRAAELGVSRNRFILLALEKALESDERWSQRFLGTLAAAREDVEGQKLVDEAQRAIAGRRTRKQAPRL
jgi:metal-responsive CopG/Arc/MetJ family transcriptional regulator